ncbi:unnamed protein product [Schistosoma intercalatum]|nr:unnamed protein product [Schistosoma intercalatum]
MATALGVVLDVGIHMNPNFREAVECVRLLLEKKFFAESKDEVALILCGSDATDNPLADEEGSFQNICLAFELAPISWKVLEFLDPDLLSLSTGDVVDALMVGADHLFNRCKDKRNIKEKHLLLVSNLYGSIDDSDVSRVSESLQSSGIKFSLIGCDLKKSINISPENRDEPGPSHAISHHHHPSPKTSPSISFLAELWDQLNGESYDFSDAVTALSIFETRSVSQRGWNVGLQIGDSITIPVVGYTHIKEAHPPTMKILYAPDPSLPLRAVTKYCTQDADPSDLNSSEVTRGYRYGGTVVPFGEEDMASIKPTSEKCFSVIGFTSADNIPHNLYTGESVLVFVAQSVKQSEDDVTNRPSCSTALAALAQALYEISGVALVRRVYNQTSAVRLGVLTPEIHGDQISLMYTDMAFSEDIRNLKLPSLPVSCEPSTSNTECSVKSSNTMKLRKDCPSQEQLSVMDSFINSMMLNYSDESDDDDGGGGELNKKDENDVENPSSNRILKVQRISNPWIQRFFACLRKRGLNPSVPLPISKQSNSSDVWLSPEMFPGLEEIITQINTNSETASVIESRNVLLNSFPPLRPASDPVDLTEEFLAKRRRLADEELYATSSFTKEIDSEYPSEQLTASSELTSKSLLQNTLASNSIQINSVQDFEDLISQQQIEVACRLLEKEIIQLVTDPFTATLLRPKAIAYLFAYRKHAQPSREIVNNSNENNHINDATSNSSTYHLEIARAYNSFIRSWRQDLIDRNLLGGNVSSQRAANDSKLSFWLETITQGFGLLCNDDIPGIGVTHSESRKFLNLEDITIPHFVETKDNQPVSPNCVLKVEHLMDDTD